MTPYKATRDVSNSSAKR